MGHAFVVIGMLILIAVAAVSHFGWLGGLAICSAIYLLMPFQYRPGGLGS